MIASVRLLSRDNAYKSREDSNNNNSDNASRTFVASFEGNLIDNFEDMNELRLKSRPAALFERFKT
ncbi:hypothetical protein A9G41_02620 [Gilliamella sp. Nev5-1]|uniref:hypothetical protein n=1 Tax=Gilliamella sp. Nev5-1 TaxID=3120251 RepID=UPI00080E070D|nr:hypothetical protein [Gilliamella apicola]OCG58247.1 hypothetical protein A9G40_10605 [Gilliamella apicola]OCG71603.1 hypothetical protein A9G41_02620 [Gilliamella apicola]